MGRTRESANLVSDKNIFVDIANDFVGIGTTAPTVALEVSGNAKVSGIVTATTFSGSLSGGTVSATTGAFSSDVTLQADLDLQDDDKILLGTGDDIQIWHSGTYSNIKNDTGQLRIRSDDLRLQNNAANENYLTGAANGAVTVYYDNSAKLATKSDGIDVTGEVQCDSLDVDGTADITGTVTLHGNLDLQDSDEIRIGTGDDLKIYHDGSNSYIIEDGTGNLIIDSNQLSLRNADTDNVLLDTTSAGAVRVRYNGTTKLETTSGGVEVTGSVTATSFSGDGSNLTNVPAGFSAINFVLS